MTREAERRKRERTGLRQREKGREEREKEEGSGVEEGEGRRAGSPLRRELGQPVLKAGWGDRIRLCFPEPDYFLPSSSPTN